MVPYQKNSLYGQSSEWRIFVEGFMTGLFAGIAIKTGINADPSSVLGNLFDAIIEVGKSINPDEDYGFYRWIFAIGMFLFAILGFLDTICLSSNRILGIILFAIGFLLAVILSIIIL